MPIGTSLATMDAAAQQFETILKTEPEVTDVLASVGSGVGRFRGRRRARRRRRSRCTWSTSCNGSGRCSRSSTMCARRPGAIKDASAQFTTVGLHRRWVRRRAAAPAQRTGREHADRPVAPDRERHGRRCRAWPTCATRTPTASPELQAQLDRARMNDLGISATEVGTAFRTAVAGPRSRRCSGTGMPDLDITLIANEQTRNDPSGPRPATAQVQRTGHTNHPGRHRPDRKRPGARPDQALQPRAYALNLGQRRGPQRRATSQPTSRKPSTQQVQLPPDYIVQNLGQAQQQQTRLWAPCSPRCRSRSS